MKRRHFLAGGTGAVLLGGPARAAFGQPAPGLVTLRAAVVPNDDLGPMLYAEQSGMFRKAGLDVQLQRSTSGAAIAAAVAGGSFDFAIASLIALITGHVHGVPFTLIAPSHLIIPGDGATGLIVLKDSPVRTARELTGKVLACSSIKDANWLASRAAIDADGGDSAATKFVELPQTAIPAALDEHRIDASILVEPVLDEALATGGYRSLMDPMAAIGPRWLVTACFTRADFASQNADTIRRFAGALHEAIVFANGHHAETAPLIAAFNGIDTATVLKMHRNTIAEYLDPALIQPVIDAVARYKVIDHAFPAAELISPYAIKPPR